MAGGLLYLYVKGDWQALSGDGDTLAPSSDTLLDTEEEVERNGTRLVFPQGNSLPLCGRSERHRRPHLYRTHSTPGETGQACETTDHSAHALKLLWQSEELDWLLSTQGK
jgi:hypothetical protein